MGKIINTFIFIILGFVIPLIGRPGLMVHHKILILVAAVVVVFLTQPGFEARDAERQRAADKNTVWLILLLSLSAVVLPVVEWGYWHPLRHHSWAFILGMSLIVLGIGLRVYAIRWLGHFFSATVEIKATHKLVTDGPYSWIRHPSYTGAFMAILGCPVLLESWYALPFSVLAMLYAYYFRIEHEEAALIRSFGEEYTNYQQNTKRMIPLVW
jgi:protein-S-isoprenylcysteine O-methyltransferase Ste14